jgi:murein DD-endopeptidase MepM/ murein hydrolase activator NlpD
MEKVVRLTGLTADRLLEAETGLPRGRGGPFIEAEPGALPANRLKSNLTTLDARLQHSRALEAVMRKLPFTAPLNSFSITSRFGKRRDPINKRWASHYGLDMGGTLRSPVYVTAPGVVTSVGWNGKYGKMIEIDHGAGIKTRYGHLHKTLVKKGQKVEFRQKIGLLGDTGRSTSAHLHYEVLFKGKAKNPMRSIEGGRHVFQG